MKYYLALLLLWFSSGAAFGATVLPDEVRRRETVKRVEGQTLHCKGKAARKYVVDDNTEVMLNGKAALLSDLKAGDDIITIVSADDSKELWWIYDLPSFEAFHRHQVLTGKATFHNSGPALVMERHPGGVRQSVTTTLDMLPGFRVWVGNKLHKGRKSLSEFATGRMLHVLVDEDWNAIAAFDAESWRDYATWAMRAQRGRLN